MEFGERFGWMLLGMIIGAMLSYFVNRLREIRSDEQLIVRRLLEIKKELDDIDACVHECRKQLQNERNERGVMKLPSTKNVALFLVVALVMVSAFLSQQASNKSNDTSDRVIELQAAQKQNLDCTTQVLFDAISALNERTTYSGAQADANIALVQAQLDLLLKSQDPNLSTTEGQALFQTYIDQVQEFIELSLKTKGQQLKFPYPTVDDLTECLAQTSAETKEPEGGS